LVLPLLASATALAVTVDALVISAVVEGLKVAFSDELEYVGLVLLIETVVVLEELFEAYDTSSSSDSSSSGFFDKKNVIVHPFDDEYIRKEKPSFTEELTATTMITTGTAAASAAVSSEISEVIEGCTDSGVYAPGSSSSYEKNDTAAAFYIQYGDLTFAEGWWVKDDIAINGVSVPLQFAVANVSNSTSVLGISFESLEASNTNDSGSFTYANLPVALKNEGLIDKISYSLYLNGLQQPYGEILFGAVDSSKYTGQLYTIPLINIYSAYYENPIEFDVTLHGTGFVSYKGEETTFSTTKVPALLDSGTTLFYAPQDMADMFAAAVNAEWDDDLQYYMMSCPSDKEAMGSFAFDLGGFIIYAPLENFIVTTSDSSSCALGVMPQDELYVILGDVFLSSAYVVYDLEDYEISIAQANYDGADSEDISAIISTVPGAIQAPSYSATWSTTASIVSGGDIFSSNATNPWTSTDDNGLSSFTNTAGSTKINTASSGSKTGSATATKTSSSSSSTKTSTKAKNAANSLSAWSQQGLLAGLMILFTSLF